MRTNTWSRRRRSICSTSCSDTTTRSGPLRWRPWRTPTSRPCCRQRWPRAKRATRPSTRHKMSNRTHGARERGTWPAALCLPRVCRGRGCGVEARAGYGGGGGAHRPSRKCFGPRTHLRPLTHTHTRTHRTHARPRRRRAHGCAYGRAGQFLTCKRADALSSASPQLVKRHSFGPTFGHATNQTQPLSSTSRCSLSFLPYKHLLFCRRRLAHSVRTASANPPLIQKQTTNLGPK
mmetsp:Transcript_51395/g.111836  ORF Transcript_51395/g.111836 Transcript_51395/m.111836 type:complete len:234 (+) Transcript_51395:1093-1794(+)